jgi:hypothetical protein
MRVMFLAAAIAVALSINIRSSEATEGPWCASVNVGAGTEVQDCRMRSLEMCRKQVIAGNRGSCYPTRAGQTPGKVQFGASASIIDYSTAPLTRCSERAASRVESTFLTLRCMSAPFPRSRE